LIDRRAGHGTALLIIDMISCWDFPDADRLLAPAARIAPRIAALKRRCADERIPAIYANDNRGQWRSDFKYVVRESLDNPGDGARITQYLAPADEDYFILKPKHSAFFATPLELLLDHLRAHRLLVTGVTSDQCIAATVADARMRDFDVVVPGDCVATLTTARNRRALQALREAFETPTPAARGLRLARR
jgi:nicotinamidase-related amidase